MYKNALKDRIKSAVFVLTKNTVCNIFKKQVNDDNFHCHYLNILFIPTIWWSKIFEVYPPQKL